MTQSRTFLTLAAVAALGVGLTGWAPPSVAQSNGSTGLAPAVAAPATTATPAAKAPKAKKARTPRAPGAGIEGRIKSLHEDLKITAAQEDQFNAMAQVMRDNGKAMAELGRKRRAAAKTMTAVDNLKTYEEISDAHTDGLKKLVPAFQKLYDSMSVEQKKTADTVFNQRVNRCVKATTSPSQPATPTKS